ncbi:hypothetical protein [Marinobacter bohaiensis]|uniref:hypothetical protein n=1 Tax=Marinobacter bohaiensis TaxID=2201898 RepID=UPI0013A6D7FC|nr:hypothetical protein [Marinobacter bohaiensis]
MKENWKIIYAALARFILVAVGFAALLGILLFDIVVLGNDIPEISATEISQELLLGATAILFLMLGRHYPARRGLYVLVAGFFAAFLIRELDALFDLVYHGFWKVPALAVTLGAIAYARRQKGTTLKPLADFVRSPEFTTIAYGLAIVFVFSRLFGMGFLWENVMGAGFQRIVKNVAEEGVELLGYGFVFSGALRYYLLSRNPGQTATVSQERVVIDLYSASEADHQAA